MWPGRWSGLHERTTRPSISPVMPRGNTWDSGNVEPPGEAAFTPVSRAFGDRGVIGTGRASARAKRPTLREPAVQARDVIEIGAQLSAHAGLVVESPYDPDPEAIRETWQASRKRVRRWLRRLHDASESTAPDAPDDVLAVARETLLADLPARCWAALLAARAERTGDREHEAIARNVLLGRLRVRRYVLEWLLDDPRVDRTELASIDRLRRRTERWTDMLTGPLVVMHDLEEFAFDPERSRDLVREGMTNPNSGVWSLMLAGIRAAFGDLPPDGPRARAENRRFVRSILAALPPDAFHLDGPFRSVRLARIRRMTSLR